MDDEESTDHSVIVTMSSCPCKLKKIIVYAFDILLDGEVQMFIELSFVLFSLLLVIYSAWCHHKRGSKGYLHLTLSFGFLTLSTTLQMIISLMWTYGVSDSIVLIRLLELLALALFSCFTITAVVALRKICKDNENEHASTSGSC